MLRGIPEEAANELRVLAQHVQRLQARATALEGAGFITAKEADAKFSPPVMARELSANGSAPLNVVTVGSRTILQPQPVKGRK